MSTVTNVILTCALGDDDKLPAVNEYLTREHFGLGLLAVDRLWPPGDHGKAMETHVWIGAFNCLDRAEFLAAIADVHWDDRDAVRVFLQLQDDEGFRDPVRLAV